MKSFGSKELIRCLFHLGFSQQPQVGSRHLKFKCPKQHIAGERPVVEVLQGKSEFDRVTQNKIIGTIKKHSFSLQEILIAMD